MRSSSSTESMVKDSRCSRVSGPHIIMLLDESADQVVVGWQTMEQKTVEEIGLLLLIIIVIPFPAIVHFLQPVLCVQHVGLLVIGWTHFNSCWWQKPTPNSKDVCGSFTLCIRKCHCNNFSHIILAYLRIFLLQNVLYFGVLHTCHVRPISGTSTNMLLQPNFKKCWYLFHNDNVQRTGGTRYAYSSS